MAGRNWPLSRIYLITNGFFLHRHPELPHVLDRYNVCLELSIHDLSEAYLARARESVGLIKKWRTRHTFSIRIAKVYECWTRRHHGFGAHVLPYEDGNPRRSWESCPLKTCRQLFLGRLWKCASIAYLQLQKESYPALSPKWDSYLAYQGLAPTCSDEELLAFLRLEEEAICGMCPSDPERFDKPSPLIPLGILRQTSRSGTWTPASGLAQQNVPPDLTFLSFPQPAGGPIKRRLRSWVGRFLSGILRRLPLDRLAPGLMGRLRALLRKPYHCPGPDLVPDEHLRREVLRRLDADAAGPRRLPGSDLAQGIIPGQLSHTDKPE